MKRFFRVAGFVFFVLGGMMFPDVFALADTSITSNIAVDTTWNTGGGTYIIENAISIDSGVTLTIDPGVVVKFRSSSVSLTVNGILDAQGTATSSIYFTSINDDTAGGTTPGSSSNPQPADWTFILVGSTGTVTFNYSDVRYGGATYNTNIYNNGGTITMSYSTSTEAVYDGLYNASGNTTIATSTFSGNGQHGVRGAGSGTFSVAGSNFYDNSTSAASFDFGSGLTLSNSGNTASGTGERGFTVTGTLGSDQTWQADGVPYIVSSTFTIPSGQTLTINPNAILKFENSSAQISVSGTLTVQQGAVPDIVNIAYFTSIKDDTIGGDTNGDATSTAPTSGDWTFILVNSGGVATIEHAFVGYGGATYGANLYNNGGTVNISTTTIAYGSSYGIYHAGGTTNVKQSVFRNNGSYGYYNGTTATTTATNNYWGDVSGPYNALYNPSGTGNAVSNYVDFDSWLGSSTPQYVLDEYAVNGTQLRFQWKATSTQNYLSEWNNAVATWNDRGAVNIVDATSTVDLTVEEYSDALDPALGDYRTETSPPSLRLNKAKLSTRAFNQIQNTATHELGHALGLLHSYWENILYARQTFQTTLGPEDVAAYNYCWVDHTNCNY